MHIRLDPPELGALQVTVHMEDGVMSAMFQTSTDDATRRERPAQSGDSLG